MTEIEDLPRVVHKACFVITGRFVTDHARDRVFEFGWEEGLRFLTVSIPELTMEQRLGLLSGKLQLKGSSSGGLKLVDEKSSRRAKVLGRYSWKFAGAWYDRPTKKLWMPYAWVNRWNADDMVENRIPNRYHPKPAGAYLSEACGGSMAAWGRFRNVRYMDDPVEDRTLIVDVPLLGKQSVLWKVLGDAMPLWMEKISDAQTAIEQFIAAGKTLEERGAEGTATRLSEVTMPKGNLEAASIRMPPGPPLPDTDDIRREHVSRQNSLFADLMPAGLPPDVAAGVMASLTDDSEPVAESTKDLAGTKWAWVQGDGTVWKCRNYMDHQRMAGALVEKFELRDPEDRDNPDNLLTENNWVKIGVGLVGCYAHAGRRVTARQRDVVHEWLMLHEADEDTVGNWMNRGLGADY